MPISTCGKRYIDGSKSIERVEMKKKKIKMSNTKKPDYSKKILEVLKKCRKKPITYKALLKEVRGKNFDFTSFVTCLESLKKRKVIKEGRDGIVLCEKPKLKRATIIKLNKTFGFARLEEDGTDVFISGRDLLGALPDDVVLLRVRDTQEGSPEGEVVEIEEANCSLFTGRVVGENFNVLIPDIMPQYEMIFKNPRNIELHTDDKVLARITKRGKRHSEHKCEIVSNFGTSQKAAVCAQSMLRLNGISLEFPDDVLENAREAEDYSEIAKEAKNRTDLRDLPIFTIDSAYTKDIDDAINVRKTKSGFELGVHIADVSHYVKAKSPLDREAFERGTSIYYANKVVPMLPKELSNGICSLNEGEDRLAFSCLMKLDKSGKLLDFDFKKTVIRSRVKGVYSEINSILAGDESEDLKSKYREVIDEFPAMKELAEILKKNKLNRGAPQIESAEGSLIIDENDVCIGAVRRERGESEEIIEDFMLLANESAARFAKKNKLPFVYRIHEDPNTEKIESLKEVLNILGIPHSFSGRVSPGDLSGVLDFVRGKDSAMIVNSLVLRSMAKARYSSEPIGHFGLVIDDYAHFTSPIRRYPDLAIHRIMSAFLSGASHDEINRKFSKFAEEASKQSSETELTAMSLERDCDDCYKAEYLKTRIGEEADGVICSVMDFGFFVTLDDTCEGLVRTESLGDGEYSVSDLMTLRNENTGEKYSVGDRVTVRIDDANVNSGKVDFSLVKKL